MLVSNKNVAMKLLMEQYLIQHEKLEFEVFVQRTLELQKLSGITVGAWCI